MAGRDIPLTEGIAGYDIPWVEGIARYDIPWVEGIARYDIPLKDGMPVFAPPVYLWRLWLYKVEELPGSDFIMTMREINTNQDGVIGFFAPRTWWFWRAVITCFCACCLIGHWLEFPYCWFTDSLFNCVDDDYALFIDPWFHPYWCYGFGALGMTLFLEPTKRWFARRHKTMRGAVGESYAWAVVLAMLMEWGCGVLVNQPDATGHYPYWDNSQLPLNVGGQAWLVNDVFIGLVAMAYLWLMFPLVCKGYQKAGKRANAVFACVVVVFALCCIASYTILALR